jgi:glutamine amidotransferase
MCIAILNTKGVINKDTLLTCWNNNPDGAGMIYTTNNNELKIFKEMNDFDRFYSEYKKQRKVNKQSNFVLHFRIATSGKIDLNNCHPFKVNKNLAFVHNGMIDIIPMSSNVSDTFTFNEAIIKNLGSNFLYNEAIIRLIETYIGYSKLVFLNNMNEATIINEELGMWDADNWYSNNTYQSKKEKYTKVTYQKDYYKTGDICDICDSIGANWYGEHYSYLCKKCGDYYDSMNSNDKDYSYWNE